MAGSVLPPSNRLLVACLGERHECDPMLEAAFMLELRYETAPPAAP
jgi:hypothetical protein